MKVHFSNTASFELSEGQKREAAIKTLKSLRGGDGIKMKPSYGDVLDPTPWIYEHDDCRGQGSGMDDFIRKATPLDLALETVLEHLYDIERMARIADDEAVIRRADRIKRS
jgi:hypothetical protein